MNSVFARIVLLHFGVMAFVTSDGQSIQKKITTFPTTPVVSASLDRLGDLYLVLKSGEIKKYDTDGNFMAAYTPASPVTQLEPWNPLRVFAYLRDRQEIVFLDRTFEVLQRTPVDSSLAFKPWLASPSFGNSFWILDQADFTIKKADMKTGAITGEAVLTLPAGSKPDFTYLREYQNLLFLVDQKTGISVYSVVGKLIVSFPLTNPLYVGYLGEEIYYLENGILKFYDLYTEDRREFAVDPQARFAFVTDERLLLVKDASVEVWEYKP
jgi:hypothetical protein